jgi:hypothetical protein
LAVPGVVQIGVAQLVLLLHLWQPSDSGAAAVLQGVLQSALVVSNI